MKPREEALRDTLSVETVRQMLLQRLVGACTKSIVVELGPRRSDDPEVGRKQAVGIEPVQRWKQHAPGKVARRSEHQQGRRFFHEGAAYRPLIVSANTECPLGALHAGRSERVPVRV